MLEGGTRPPVPRRRRVDVEVCVGVRLFLFLWTGTQSKRGFGDVGGKTGRGVLWKGTQRNRDPPSARV